MQLVAKPRNIVVVERNNQSSRGLVGMTKGRELIQNIAGAYQMINVPKDQNIIQESRCGLRPGYIHW
jgi:hypothetical protein